MKKYLLLCILLGLIGCTNKESETRNSEKILCDKIMKMDSEFDSIFIKAKEIEIDLGKDNYIGFIGKAILKNNKIYISGSRPAGIYVLSIEGKIIKKIGNVGSGPGEYRVIRDFDVDENGNIFLLDTPNGRVSVFSDNGNFINSFPTKYATNLCTDNDDGYFLYNSAVEPKSGLNVISHFDKEGKLIKEFCPVFTNVQIIGGTIVHAPDNNIYVCNVSTYLAKKYSVSGDYLSEFKDASTSFKGLDIKGRLATPEELKTIFSLTGMAVTKSNIVILEYSQAEPKGKWNDIYYTDGTLLKRGIKINNRFRLNVKSDDNKVYYIEEPIIDAVIDEKAAYNYKILCYSIRGEK